ncbi:MAG TPA: glycosyltransferase [Gemmataceae bacterium]|jgi:glycosyltransferase involved in cell wall biosynthesis|nr:glycosyltransferase [Gemmataceae bacterium]
MHLLNFPLRPTRRTGTEPVRVCFVIDRLSRAGTETQLLALIHHLDRSRVSPTLCLLNGSDRESRSLLPDDCPTVDLNLQKLTSLKSISAAARLVSFWRRNRIEVVQTYFNDSTYFAVPFARLCGIRQVIRVRNNLGYWLTRRHRTLGRLVGRLTTQTLTNSEDACQALLEAEGLQPNRVIVIENGVDLDRFRNLQPANTVAPTVRVGAVANLRPVKNIDAFVRVAATVCRNDPRVRFEVAGEGAQRVALETLIQQHGLCDRFNLRGSVADVPRFLSSVDIAVLPSHSESMSNALLEYMAARRAIVATDVGANAKVVRNGVDGLIVAAGDEIAIADAIQRFLSEPALALSCAASARERAETYYSRAAMVRRFEDFYASLFNETARGGSAGSL